MHYYGTVWSFTTQADPNIVTLFSEPFPNFSNWTAVGPLGLTNWSTQATANAGGTSPELRLSWTPQFDGESRIRSIVISAPNNKEMLLSFQWFFDWYANPSGTIGMAATYDGGATRTSVWSVVNPTANVGPQTVNLTFTTPALAEAANLQLELYFIGNSFNNDNMYFDNILLNYQIPVELTAFTANVSGNSVNLNWNTATELNNSGFEIERKSHRIRPSRDWKKLVMLQVLGLQPNQKHIHLPMLKLVLEVTLID